VSTVLIGARNQQQLQDNLIATDLVLTDSQLQRLNQVSAVHPAYPYYPYWNGQFSERYQRIVESSLIQN
jgi:diketogulonate reductase-like aldo/keto reductase